MDNYHLDLEAGAAIADHHANMTDHLSQNTLYHQERLWLHIKRRVPDRGEKHISRTKAARGNRTKQKQASAIHAICSLLRWMIHRTTYQLFLTPCFHLHCPFVASWGHKGDHHTGCLKTLFIQPLVDKRHIGCYFFLKARGRVRVRVHFYQDTGSLSSVSCCDTKVQPAIRCKAHCFTNLLCLCVMIERHAIGFLPEHPFMPSF